MYQHLTAIAAAPQLHHRRHVRRLHQNGRGLRAADRRQARAGVRVPPWLGRGRGRGGVGLRGPALRRRLPLPSTRHTSWPRPSRRASPLVRCWSARPTATWPSADDDQPWRARRRQGADPRHRGQASTLRRRRQPPHRHRLPPWRTCPPWAPSGSRLTPPSSAASSPDPPSPGHNGPGVLNPPRTRGTDHEHHDHRSPHPAPAGPRPLDLKEQHPQAVLTLDVAQGAVALVATEHGAVFLRVSVPEVGRDSLMQITTDHLYLSRALQDRWGSRQPRPGWSRTRTSIFGGPVAPVGEGQDVQFQEGGWRIVFTDHGQVVYAGANYDKAAAALSRHGLEGGAVTTHTPRIHPRRLGGLGGPTHPTGSWCSTDAWTPTTGPSTPLDPRPWAPGTLDDNDPGPEGATTTHHSNNRVRHVLDLLAEHGRGSTSAPSTPSICGPQARSTCSTSSAPRGMPNHQAAHGPLGRSGLPEPHHPKRRDPGPCGSTTTPPQPRLGAWCRRAARVVPAPDGLERLRHLGLHPDAVPTPPEGVLVDGGQGPRLERAGAAGQSTSRADAPARWPKAPKGSRTAGPWLPSRSGPHSRAQARQGRRRAGPHRVRWIWTIGKYGAVRWATEQPTWGKPAIPDAPACAPSPAPGRPVPRDGLGPGDRRGNPGQGEGPPSATSPA